MGSSSQSQPPPQQQQQQQPQPQQQQQQQQQQPPQQQQQQQQQQQPQQQPQTQPPQQQQQQQQQQQPQQQQQQPQQPPQASNSRFSPSTNDGNVGPTPSNTATLDGIAFSAKSENAFEISQVLSAIYKVDPEKSKKKDIQNQFAICKIAENALTFIVEEGKHFQGLAGFKNTFFKEYNFNASPQQGASTADQQQQQQTLLFKINLSMLLDCLTIFGNSSFTSVQFLYKGYGSPFILLLEEIGGGVETHCSIKTMDADEILEFDLLTPVSNKLFMESENLLEAFGELDYTSNSLNILLTPEAPFFRLSTNGQMGSFRMDYCKKKSADDTFEYHDLQIPIEYSFPLSLIKPCIKALSLSKKTRISLTQGGLLSFHHIITTGPQQHLVEFFILASSNNLDENYYNQSNNLNNQNQSNNNNNNTDSNNNINNNNNNNNNVNTSNDVRMEDMQY